MIAMAIACKPRLLIADEPTPHWCDHSNAQIVDLLLELQQKERMSLILITHDLALVAEAAHRIIVMYAGQVVEEDEQKIFSVNQNILTLKRYCVLYRSLQKVNLVCNLYPVWCQVNTIVHKVAC